MKCNKFLICENRASGIGAVMDCLVCKLRKDREIVQQKAAAFPLVHEHSKKKAQAKLQKFLDDMAHDMYEASRKTSSQLKISNTPKG